MPQFSGAFLFLKQAKLSVGWAMIIGLVGQVLSASWANGASATSQR